MAVVIQEPITGSDATFTRSGTQVALDVNITTSGLDITADVGSVTLYDTSGAELFFDNNRVAGSIVNLPSELGSVYNLGSVEVFTDTGSVLIYQPTNSELQAQVTQETNPWIVLGSQRITAIDGIGSVLLSPGSLEVFQTVGTDMIVNGSVRQLDDPWRVTGSIISYGVGSVLLSPGSLEVFQTTQADMQVQAAGDAGHDQGDVGSPVKIGGKVTSGIDAFPTAVNDADRTDAYFDELGYQHVVIAPRRTIKRMFDEQVFDDDPKSTNSGSIDVSKYRYGNLFIHMSGVGTPTNIRIIPQFEGSGAAEWFDYAQDQWVDMRYINGQEPVNEVMGIKELPGGFFRIIGSAAGTTSSNRFIITVDAEFKS